MNRKFRYKNVSFDYNLLLEDRKTISATVFPNQDLMVKAPVIADDKRIEDFLKRKFRWILKQKRYFAQFKNQPEKQYISGESFRYRGRSYKLLVRDNGQDERLSLYHGTLVAYTKKPKNNKRVKNLVDAWYNEKAHIVFAERLSECVKRFDYNKEPGLITRKMTKRWGSYSHKKNRVILNVDLIKASKRFIDYVIIHELCHVKHKKHNRAFYDLLESKLPKWEKLKTELELSLLS